MKTVKVKKGWSCEKIAGKPSSEVVDRSAVSRVAAVPVAIAFIKPRLLVAEGDRVKIGTALFEDKKNPDIKFLSPGAGKIEKITYGPRRVIEEIIILLDADEAKESFKTFQASEIAALDRQDLIAHLMAGGMWGFIRQLPFRAIADPKATPNAVWITLGSADPFQPAAGVYLKNNQSFFDLGLKALERLANTVNISWFDTDSKQEKHDIDITPTHRICGSFPASDAGVVLFHTKKSPDENQDWYMDGQDVVLLGKFLQTGAYPTDRIVAFSDGTAAGCHVKTRMGARFKDVAAGKTSPDPARWVAGGLFSGYSGTADTFLGFYETSVMVVKDPHQGEFFGFVRPGFSKLSNSRTIMSTFFAKPLPADAGLHGEERPCVNCGYCAAVCPVNIMPQYTYKSLYADEIEDALKHGLLDCVECGLCSFVCPSKIDLTDFLIAARRRYHKELQQGV